jgi:hypothetical protein
MGNRDGEEEYEAPALDEDVRTLKMFAREQTKTIVIPRKISD